MVRNNGTRAARLRTALVAAAIATIVLCGGRASAWAASKGMPTPPPAATETSMSARGTPATSARSAPAGNYAERETSARDLEKFKGGDVVIIGSTGVIVVLLVVIIVLLL
jgi:hypothetical protein